MLLILFVCGLQALGAEPTASPTPSAEPAQSSPSPPPGGTGKSGLLAVSGDFENGAAGWQISGQVVPDPVNAKNHVLSLSDKQIPAASAPLAIPDSVDAVTAHFRVLAPKKLKLNSDDDSELILRVRLYSAKYDSRITEVGVARSGRWKTITVHFSKIEELRHEFLIEALNSSGPFYVDDFSVTATTPAKHNSHPR